MGLSDSIFGTYTMQSRSRVRSIVSKVNALKGECRNITTSKEKRKVFVEPQHIEKELTEEEIAFLNITNEFRKRLREGETIEDILPQALAVCREATRRKIGMFHYDVQVEAAVSMLEGSTIAEMKTGEGKTLVQILCAYVNGLEATKSLNPSEWSGVHIMTANEALATRDAINNSSVFNLLGFSVANIPSRNSTKRDPASLAQYRKRKQEAYKSDIIYSTATTIAFDYLEDNTCIRPSDRYIVKPFGYAIIDEADDILLDQATNPLILTGEPEGLSEEYKKAKENQELKYRRLCAWATKMLYGEPGLTATVFRQYDRSKAEKFKTSYAYYEDERQVYLSDHLREQLYAGFETATPEQKAAMIEREDALITCIITKHAFNKDVEYKVETDAHGKGTIMLIDSNTGRRKVASKYTNGIQEAIEAKEEFLENNVPGAKKRYHIGISKPLVVKAMCTYPDFLKQYESVSGMTGTSDITEFKEIYGLQTYEVPSRKTNVRIDEPDELYATKEKKYKAIIEEVLRCRETMQPVLIGTSSDEESKEISSLLKEAGVRHKLLNSGNEELENQIIATAGILGSVTVATNMAGRGTDIKLGEGVKDVGGLYVIGVSKNKSVRIDNQLRGRAARQGDPGKSKYFMSFDDPIQKLFFPDGTFDSLKKAFANQDGPIRIGATIGLANKAQYLKESSDKDSRRTAEKFNIKYTEHKGYIYGLRKNILLCESKEELTNCFKDRIIPLYKKFLDSVDDKSEINALLGRVINVEEAFSRGPKITDELCLSIGDKLSESIHHMDEKTFKDLRIKLLNVIDIYWLSHIDTLEDLKKNAYITTSQDPFKDYEEAAMLDFSEKLMPAILNELIAYTAIPSMKFGDYEIEHAREGVEAKQVVL